VVLRDRLIDDMLYNFMINVFLSKIVTWILSGPGGVAKIAPPTVFPPGTPTGDNGGQD
jgi:hypothetical protein